MWIATFCRWKTPWLKTCIHFSSQTLILCVLSQVDPKITRITALAKIWTMCIRPLKPYLSNQLSLQTKLCIRLLKCFVSKILFCKTKHSRSLVQRLNWVKEYPGNLLHLCLFMFVLFQSWSLKWSRLNKDKQKQKKIEYVSRVLLDSVELLYKTS